MPNILYWFRNDLRVHDNEALLKASLAGKVVPIYVFDERQFRINYLGDKKTGIRRAQFLIESVQSLRDTLRSLGSDLIIKTGIPEEVIAQVAYTVDAKEIYASKEITQEETNVEANLAKKLKPLNIDIHLIWEATLFHVRDLPFQIHFLPETFTEFRQKIEKGTKVRITLPAPTNLHHLPDVDLGNVPTLNDLGYDKPNFVANPKSAFPFKGGETAALQRLHDYVWNKELLKSYKDTRNGLIGTDYSSKLSAWLSLGCISPRRIYEEVKRYETEKVANESTYWLIFELLWRDYFYFVALKHGSRIFKTKGIKFDITKEWKRDKALFQTWAEGKTGVPFIDANMKELNETGYMSNRGRQNVASYLAKELGVSWTWGATYFESKLIDYHVSTNWGNWNYLAGVGNDPREDRSFNIDLQSKKYDAAGEYVALWNNELDNK